MSVPGNGGDDQAAPEAATNDKPDDDATPPSGIPVQQLPVPVPPPHPGQPWQPMPYGQPPWPAPRRPRRRWKLALLSAAIVVVLLVAGYTLVQYLSDRDAYDDGHQSYLRADCRAAIVRFDDAIGSWRIITIGESVDRARAERDECEVFQSAADEQETDLPGSLVAYLRFIADRPASPLTEAARTRVTGMLEQADLNKLATTESCDTLPELRDRKLINGGATAVRFHAACGLAYLVAGNQETAFATYRFLFSTYSTEEAAKAVEADIAKEARWCAELERFRREPIMTSRPDLFPGLLLNCARKDDSVIDGIALCEEFLSRYKNHRLTGEVTGVFAGLLNKNVRAGRADNFGGAQEIGVPGGDNAVIEVYNDSPEALRVALSGPNPVVETLGGCPACPEKEPGVCREQFATKARIVVQPGVYEVAFDVPGKTIVSAYARWVLEPGKGYYQCISVGPAR